MTAPLFLLLLAAAISLLAPHYLRSAGWVRRQPSWGIWAWHASTLTVVSAVLLAMVTLAMPVLPFAPHVADVVRNTTHVHLRHHYETPAGNALAWAALLVAVVLSLRIAFFAVRELRMSCATRLEQLQALRLVGRRDPGGFMVLDHPVPLIYCLPGRARTVVVTTGAREALSPAELESALAHERSHLRARHHLALALSAALARSFPVVGLFSVAHHQIQTLVEMQADDAATEAHGRRAMASALLTLGGQLRPDSAESTAGSPAARVRRLLEPASSAGLWRQRVLVGAATATLLAAPVALALLPAVTASDHDCCHIAMPGSPGS